MTVDIQPKAVDHRIEKRPFNACVLLQERFSVRWNSISSAAAQGRSLAFRYKKDCWIVGSTGRKKLAKSAWLAYNRLEAIAVSSMQ